MAIIGNDVGGAVDGDGGPDGIPGRSALLDDKGRKVAHPRGLHRVWLNAAGVAPRGQGLPGVATLVPAVSGQRRAGVARQLVAGKVENDVCVPSAGVGRGDVEAAPDRLPGGGGAVLVVAPDIDRGAAQVGAVGVEGQPAVTAGVEEIHVCSAVHILGFLECTIVG